MCKNEPSLGGRTSPQRGFLYTKHKLNLTEEEAEKATMVSAIVMAIVAMVVPMFITAPIITAIIVVVG
jgi:uncharacterized membrane protein YqjE